MRKLTLNSLEECNAFLAQNTHFANGKNLPVTYLYATVASNPRRCAEGLWGIYLAKPQFAWMALWMAIIARTAVKKRQIQYLRPDTEKGDQIGRIRVFNPGHLPLDRVMRPEAYVYLFEPEPISSYLRLQLSNQSEVENLRLLEEFGFQRERVSARGEIRPALVWSLGECAVAGADAWEISDECLVVGVDEWQIAVVNVPQLVPSVEAVVSGRLIRELSARVEWLDGEVGEQYLV